MKERKEEKKKKSKGMEAMMILYGKYGTICVWTLGPLSMESMILYGYKFVQFLGFS